MNIDKLWYGDSVVSLFLLPLSGLFRIIVALRRWAFRVGWLQVTKLPVPVIVVGNITAGGTGKTPLVETLVAHFNRAGWRTGIICRGYRGQATHWPQLVDRNSSAALVGDEALLLARRCACPVAAGPDRVAAAKMLLEQKQCDLVISDDGLQHYRLGRTVEIAVVDAARGLGNGRHIPAGPLRETVERLNSVDIVVVNGGDWDGLKTVGKQGQGGPPAIFTMLYEMQSAIGLLDNAPRSLTDFSGRQVHAIAGIGHPERFFNNLRALGIQVIAHPFPDHFAYTGGDVHFNDSLPVLMTEKDAVKLREVAQDNQYYVPVSVSMDSAIYTIIEKKLRM